MRRATQIGDFRDSTAAGRTFSPQCFPCHEAPTPANSPTGWRRRAAFCTLRSSVLLRVRRSCFSPQRRHAERPEGAHPRASASRCCHHHSPSSSVRAGRQHAGGAFAYYSSSVRPTGGSAFAIPLRPRRDLSAHPLLEVEDQPPSLAAPSTRVKPTLLSRADGR